MREIKFRSWCEVDTKEGDHLDRMVYFDKMECDNGLGFFCDTPEDVYHINEYYSTMQFTGLKDKNGREVYEGDVLKFDPNIEGFNDEYWQRYKVKIPNMFFTWEKYNDLGYMHIEVIGNIHENPELI